MTRWLFAAAALGLLLASGRAAAQATAPAPGSSEPEPADAGGTTSLSPSAYFYVLPDAEAYVQPTLALNRGALHLEARYNYEALRTASTWVGYNLAGGERFAWELTPIVGAVFGRTNGIAPGCKGSLGWWKLELYSEGEFVFDFGSLSDGFFYNWSELTLSPVEWFRFGLVTQRTRVYATEREFERGLLAGFAYGPAELTLHVFNPDDSQPIVVISLSASFEPQPGPRE